MQRNFQHGGQVYDATGQANFFMDFSANINPLGLPDSVRRTILENFEGVVNYPDPNATELKNILAARYEIPQKNLVLLNGAAEFFYLYCNVERPKKILIPVPSFSEYERAAWAIGADVEYFFLREEDEFIFDEKKFFEKVTAEKFDCVIIGRPNNPTGNLISVDAVKKISEVVNVVVDESFIDFLPIESARAAVNKKISVVQSLTKIFAIPGLRLGFAVVDEILAERLNFAKDVWNVNFLAQKAGVAALADEKFLHSTRLWLDEEKKYFTARLRELPEVKVFEPTVNFVLIKFSSSDVANFVVEKLRAEKILVRSCGNFVGLDERFLRLAIKRRHENNFLIDAMKNFLP
ncbi:MAG: aminotransferase class I/II-fold pyridoxal phosphate-dependent enzyme [Selenomonadaceae bacterium]|nr:aminotransferase class I/II-fold pyridoxal phosphate-dependent enzyme [Selenomonadaceae bacterium]